MKHAECIACVKMNSPAQVCMKVILYKVKVMQDKVKVMQDKVKVIQNKVKVMLFRIKVKPANFLSSSFLNDTIGR